MRMTEDRWKEIIDLVNEKFELTARETQELPEEDGGGTMEYLEFTGPMGQMRLEFTVKPLVLDKKVIGSKRIGSESTVQYTYSDTEKAHIFKVYRKQGDEWSEMEMPKGDFIF